MSQRIAAIAASTIAATLSVGVVMYYALQHPGASRRILQKPLIERAPETGPLVPIWQRRVRILLLPSQSGKGLTAVAIETREAHKGGRFKTTFSAYAYGFDLKNGSVGTATCYVHRGYEKTPICLITD